MVFENIVGKGLTAGYQHFLLYQEFFLAYPIQDISNYSSNSEFLVCKWSKFVVVGWLYWGLMPL